MRYMLAVHRVRRILDLFSLLEGLGDCVLPDGPTARGAATSWRVYLVGVNLRRGPRVGRDVVESLGELYGEFLDFFEERLCVMDADAMDEEDDSACAGDGDEHPGVDGRPKTAACEIDAPWLTRAVLTAIRRGRSRRESWGSGRRGLRRRLRAKGRCDRQASRESTSRRRRSCPRRSR